MAELTIESNGFLEKTAVYYNGQQISGIRELLLNLDEEGQFDSVIKYEASDGQEYNKNIFEGFLDNIKTKPPSFTEEEARHLRSITVDSDGDIGNTVVLRDGEEDFGIVSLFLHIKTPEKKKSGILGLGKEEEIETAEFRAQITYRNEDDSLETEDVF